jgi:hypothetical protein
MALRVANPAGRQNTPSADTITVTATAVRPDTSRARRAAKSSLPPHDLDMLLTTVT